MECKLRAKEQWCCAHPASIFAFSHSEHRTAIDLFRVGRSLYCRVTIRRSLLQVIRSRWWLEILLVVDLRGMQARASKARRNALEVAAESGGKVANNVAAPRLDRVLNLAASVARSHGHDEHRVRGVGVREHSKVCAQPRLMQGVSATERGENERLLVSRTSMAHNIGVARHSSGRHGKVEASSRVPQAVDRKVRNGAVQHRHVGNELDHNTRSDWAWHPMAQGGQDQLRTLAEPLLVRLWK